MPSFFNKLTSHAQAIYRSGDEPDSVMSTKCGKNGRSRRRARNMRSTAYPAACRGLYGVTAKQRHIDPHSSGDKHSSYACEHDDPNDPIIKYSMYPQMIGKRRSELEAEFRSGTMDHDRAPTVQDSRELTPRTGRPVRRQHSARRVRRLQPVESEDSCSSDEESDTDCNFGKSSEGRPVRVCMYPQAKYIKEPVTTPLAGYESSSTIEFSTPRAPSYRNWKRDRLPYDEYQILRRRQVMQCARSVLEPHYFHRGAKPKKGLVGHGEMQCFNEYHTERRRVSRIQYAARKALQADLDPFSNAFSYAMTRHAQKERFCELSDVDGAPIDEALMWNFIRMYRRAQDKAHHIEEPKLAMVRPDEIASCTSDTESIDHWRQDMLRRVDSGITTYARVKRPALSSRMSWSSSDGEDDTTTRLLDLE